VRACGDRISRPRFNIDNWYPAEIPGTIVYSLVKSEAYGDPCVGLNMKNIPGYKHGKTTHFSLHQMPDDSPFKSTWWYRCEFSLENMPSDSITQTWLHIDGLNYGAHVWINGKRIAAADHCIGSYRRFDYNISHAVSFDKINACAFEIIPPQPDDLNLTFIDWGPVPPDDSMGIWQPISISNSQTVALRRPFITSLLDCVDFTLAQLTISATLINTSNIVVHADLISTIEGIECSKAVMLEPKETKEVTFSPQDFPQLSIKNPRVWWPYQLGTPEMYRANLHVFANGKLSDETDLCFGIRDIASRLNEHGSRQFTINGKDILIRGSAWKPDLFMAQSDNRDDIDIAYLKTMNLNAFRMEGMLASDSFWDKCDKEGVMVLAGWPCCNHWENWTSWKPGDFTIAYESLRSQIIRLRDHPSFIAWFYGSDQPPPPNVEKTYVEILDEHYKNLPRISSATAQVSPRTGPTGVKMSGPYTFVPPVYWYTESMPGVATGFNTETGPDVCIPVYESLIKMLPADQLFPGSEAWNHHAGLGFFTNTDIVNNAIVKRYGKPETTENFCDTAQLLGYECWRAMYEAYNRNFPKGTGIIGWMHNAAWPSLLWQLYDYYLRPTGAFFGTQKACEPVHIQYSYDDASIWVINNKFETIDGLVANIQGYSLDSHLIFEQNSTVSLACYERKRALEGPGKIETISLYFLRCSLTQATNLLSDNWYWLSHDEDVFCPVPQTHFYRSLDHNADMSALRTIPKPDLTTTIINKGFGRNRVLQIQVHNPSPYIAFFTRLTIVNRKTLESISPVFWDENYPSILPGEKRMVSCRIPATIDVSDIMVEANVWH